MDKSDALTFTLPQQPLQFRFGDANHLDHIAATVNSLGLAAYEAPLPDLLALLVRRACGYVLDVGANTGLFSLLAAAANPDIKVCAFEPLGTVRCLLEENVALNPVLSPRIHVFPLALSNVSGSHEFYETINDQGLVTTSSSLEADHAESVGDEYRKQIVTTQTLDRWAEEQGVNGIALVKIDVEVHEYAVLQGALQTIKTERPYITIEVLNNLHSDMMRKIIYNQQYVDFVITPHALRFTNVLEYHSDGWNHLLCPAEKAAQVLDLCQTLKIGMEVAQHH